MNKFNRVMGLKRALLESSRRAVALGRWVLPLPATLRRGRRVGPQTLGASPRPFSEHSRFANSSRGVGSRLAARFSPPSRTWGVWPGSGRKAWPQTALRVARPKSGAGSDATSVMPSRDVKSDPGRTLHGSLVLQDTRGGPQELSRVSDQPAAPAEGVLSVQPRQEALLRRHIRELAELTSLALTQAESAELLLAELRKRNGRSSEQPDGSASFDATLHQSRSSLGELWTGLVAAHSRASVAIRSEGIERVAEATATETHTQLKGRDCTDNPQTAHSIHRREKEDMQRREMVERNQLTSNGALAAAGGGSNAPQTLAHRPRRLHPPTFSSSSSVCSIPSSTRCPTPLASGLLPKAGTDGREAAASNPHLGRPRETLGVLTPIHSSGTPALCDRAAAVRVSMPPLSTGLEIELHKQWRANVEKGEQALSESVAALNAASHPLAGETPSQAARRRLEAILVDLVTDSGAGDGALGKPSKSSQANRNVKVGRGPAGWSERKPGETLKAQVDCNAPLRVADARAIAETDMPRGRVSQTVVKLSRLTMPAKSAVASPQASQSPLLTGLVPPLVEELPSALATSRIEQQGCDTFVRPAAVSGTPAGATRPDDRILRDAQLEHSQDLDGEGLAHTDDHEPTPLPEGEQRESIICSRASSATTRHTYTQARSFASLSCFPEAADEPSTVPVDSGLPTSRAKFSVSLISQPPNRTPSSSPVALLSTSPLLDLEAFAGAERQDFEALYRASADEETEKDELNGSPLETTLKALRMSLRGLEGREEDPPDWLRAAPQPSSSQIAPSMQQLSGKTPSSQGQPDKISWPADVMEMSGAKASEPLECRIFWIASSPFRVVFVALLAVAVGLPSSLVAWPVTSALSASASTWLGVLAGSILRADTSGAGMIARSIASNPASGKPPGSFTRLQASSNTP